MNQTLALIVGSFLCFGVPIIALVVGFYVGRNGMPFEILWKDIRGGHDD